MTDNLLLKYGIEHTLHGSLYIINCLVDNLVETNVNAFSFGCILCSCINTYIETDYYGIGSCGKAYIRFINSAYATMNTLNKYFLIGQLGK